MPNRSPEPDTDYGRARVAAANAIQLAAQTRENVRATRLRLRLRQITTALPARSFPAEEARAETLHKILDAVMAAAEAPMGNLQLAEQGTLRISAQRGFKRPFLEFFAAVHEGETACGLAFARGAPVVVEAVKESPVFSKSSRDTLLQAGVLAVQSVPLVVDRERLGVLSVHYGERGIPRVKQEALAALGCTIAAAVARCVERPGPR